MFMGLLPFMEMDWRRPWTGLVTASGAIEFGFGMSECELDPSRVAATGCVPEKRRYRYAGAHRAREHALEMEAETDDLGEEYELEVDSDFPEVPANLLQPQRWSAVAWRGWLFAEGILIPGARAVVLSLRRLCNHVAFEGVRQLICLSTLWPCA